MKIRFSSYQLKLMILSIIIGTLPVIILGSYAYYNSSRTVQEKVNISNEQLLLQTKLQVEQMLKTVDNSATQLLQSSLMTGIFDKEITNYDFQLVRDLYKSISVLQSYEYGIEEVYLYSMNQNWLLTSAGLNEYSDPAFIPQLQLFSSSYLGSFWTGMPGDTEHIYYVKKYPFNAINPTGIICVVLNSSKVTGGDHVFNKNMGSTFIIDEHANIVVHNESALVGTSMSNVSYLEPMFDSDEEEGQYVSNDSGTKVTVTYRKSAYNQWTYISVVSNNIIKAESSKIGWLTLIVCVTIMIITILVSWIGSKNMYKPIKKIYNDLLRLPTLFERNKSHGELATIGEGVNYLIENQSIIMEQLQGQQGQLKEFYVQKLFSGTIKGSAFEEQLHLYHIEKRWQSMSVVAIQIDTLQGTRYEESNRDLLMFAINNIVSELVLSEQRLVPIIYNDYQVTLIGSEEQGASFNNSIFAMYSEIQNAIYQYLDIKVSVGISRAFTSFDEVQQALREAKSALHYRIGLGQEAILFIEDVQPEKEDWLRFPHEQEQALCDAMRTGDQAEADQALDELLKELFQPNTEIHDYQLKLMRLIIGLLRFGQEMNLSMRDGSVDQSALLQTLFKFRDIHEIKVWLQEQIIHPYIVEINKRRDNQHKHISEAIIEMIEGGYDTELTLEDCAARINYHPHYVSRVFRQETGVNFGEYLIQYRIEIAKKWLKESDIKVGEIAERLCYNNSANFIRSFRKIVGKTPGQYREEASWS